MSNQFKALLVRKSIDGKSFTRSIEKREINDLPRGDLLIRVLYSSLNYKDGLSCQGNMGVTRHYPHTPGIDAAGIVEASTSAGISPGDLVVVAGTPLGMDVSGGFGQYIRIPAAWAVPLPQGMSLRDSMIYGTAGLTAALSIFKLRERGILPESGTVVVTGATGGVGSMSIAILLKLGYSVMAISRKANSLDFLKKIGECDVLGYEAFISKPERSLLKETWSCGVDTIGGESLSTIIKTCKENGAVAATGLVGSSNISLSVMPFILRGVSLIGINTMGMTQTLRYHIWTLLAHDWRPDAMEAIVTDCYLNNLDSEIDKITNGRQQGRVVINMK
jgi:acrylyl-CoA reductase (NADPH)